MLDLKAHLMAAALVLGFAPSAAAQTAPEIDIAGVCQLSVKGKVGSATVKIIEENPVRIPTNDDSVNAQEFYKSPYPFVRRVQLDLLNTGYDGTKFLDLSEWIPLNRLTSAAKDLVEDIVEKGDFDDDVELVRLMMFFKTPFKKALFPVPVFFGEARLEDGSIIRFAQMDKDIAFCN